MKLNKKRTPQRPVPIRFFHTLTVLTLIFTSLVVWTFAQETRSEKEMAKLHKKWFAVKSWQADYSETYRSTKEWEMRPGIIITTEIQKTGSGHYVLDEKRGGAGNITEWYGYGIGRYSSINTVTLRATVDGKDISVTEIIKSEGNGFIGNRSEEKYGASLDIDVLTGGYGAGFDLPNSDTTTLTRKVNGLPTSYEDAAKLPPGLRDIFLPLAMKAEGWATFNGDINDTSPMVGGLAGFQLFGDMNEPKEFPLPKSGQALKGSYHGKYISKTWSLTPSGKGKALILTKCDQSWLPEDKNSVKIAVKGDGLYGEEVKIRFTLFEVTREPGTCLNSKDEKKDLDLDFYHPENSEKKFSTIESTKDGFIAETAKEVKNITITVASRDFGAWGKLKAEAGYPGLWLPILTEDDKPYITIPLDEAGGRENQIADKFEKDNNLAAGVDPLFDEEGPGKRGDGLSAYEEYRGFLIGRGNPHQRTNPKEPDLFLRPETRRLEGYLREIQNNFPAGIMVHLIEEDQYKYHMAINANNNLHNLVIQHGLWIVERNLVKPGVVGRMFGDFGSPKLCMFAAIDINEHYKQGLGKKRYIYNTIVHEIFHALNVRHHGWTHKLVKAYRNTTQIAPGVTDEGTVALYNGVSSGDVSCVMSYGIALYYEESPGRIALYEDGWPKFFQFTIDKKNYSHLCSQNTGTGAGESFQLGPAERGECIKAVQIADK